MSVARCLNIRVVGLNRGLILLVSLAAHTETWPPNVLARRYTPLATQRQRCIHKRRLRHLSELE